jgi:hypothetical protein
VNGHYPYNVATVPLMSELMKFVLSSFLLYQQYSKDKLSAQVCVELFGWARPFVHSKNVTCTRSSQPGSHFLLRLEPRTVHTPSPNFVGCLLVI